MLKLKLKSPNSDKKVNRPESGAVEQATKLRKLLLEMDSMKAQVEEARECLLEVVNEERMIKVRSGVEVTSINAPTSDGNRLMVVYAEKFKMLDRDNVQPLKDAFGDMYSALIEEVQEVSFKDNVNLNGIEAAIGSEAMTRLRGLLEVKEGVLPKKGILKEVAKMYRDGDGRADDVSALLDAVAYSPTVRAK